MRTAALTTALGLLAGIAIARATLALSATDIGGPGWSLRGNGALVVEFTAAPAVLAGGWVSLSGRGPRLALAAAGVTLALELAIGFGPILTSLDSRVLVDVCAPLAALGAGLLLARRWSLVTAMLTGVAVVVLVLGLPSLAFVLGPLLVPVILALPSLTERCALAGVIALPVALIVGLLIGQML